MAASCAGAPQKTPKASQSQPNITAECKAPQDKSLMLSEISGIHPTISIALETIAAIGSLGSPIDCGTLERKMLLRFKELGARQITVDKLSVPVYRFPDSQADALIVIADTQSNTRFKMFSLYIQRTGTDVDPPGIFNGVVSAQCRVRESGL